MSYIDDLKEVFGDKLPESHIFFATLANTTVPSYQALRKALGVTTAKENTALYKRLVEEFGDAPEPVEPLSFLTNLPESRNIPTGGTLRLSITPQGGVLPYSYQWFKAGMVIPGAESTTLEISNVTTENSGSYSVKVTDAKNASITSSECTVVVAPPAEG